MAWCRQAKNISWTNVDLVLCHPMASLGHNELTSIYLNTNTNWNKTKWMPKLPQHPKLPHSTVVLWVDFCSNFCFLYCVFFLYRDYKALYNSSTGGCKELYSHLYALSFQLRYVLLFGYYKRFCTKFVLISDNCIFFKIILFCILVLYQN